MNTAYKVIWNASLGAWVAVSELAKGHKKTKSKAIILSTITVGLFSLSHITNANIINSSSSCTSGGATVYKKALSATGAPIDGSGTFSTVAGCSANGGNYLGVSVFGAHATATNAGATAIGTNSNASKYAVALGVDSAARGEKSVAIGAGSESIVIDGIAVGGDALSNANGAIALGGNTKATQASSIALGNNAQSDTINSIALGAGSVTSVATGTSFLTNKTENTANGVVSVGTAAQTRRIQNLSDGSADQDAVTVAQLKVVDTKSTTTGTELANILGGGATYNPTTGTLTAPSYSITNPTTGVSNNVNNVGAAISGLNTAVNSPITFKDAGTGTSVNKLGSEFAIVGDDNITTTVTDGQAAIALNKDLKGLTSVETTDGTNTTTVRAGGTTSTDGTNTTVYGPNGLNINNGAVIIDSAGLNAGGVIVSKDGINANDKVISNVGNGSLAAGSKDAINGGQVDTIRTDLENQIGQAGKDGLDALAGNVSDALGGGAGYDKGTGTWTPPSYNVTDPTTGTTTPVNNVGDAIDGLNTAVNSPITFKDAGTGTSVNKLGSEFAIVGDDNITTTVTDGQAAIALNKDLKGLTSVETTDGTNTTTVRAGGTTSTDGTNTTVYGPNGLNINNGAVIIDSAGLNAGGVIVSKDGINANDKVISNVGNGSLAAGSKDAINGGQVDTIRTDLENQIGQAGKDGLDALAGNVSDALGGGAGYDKGTGTWTPPSYNVTDPTTGTTTPVNNVGDAIDGLNTAVNSPITFKDAGTGTSVNKLGSEFAIVGDDNITTTVTDGQAAIALNKDLKGLTSVETTDGTNTTTVRAGGTTSTDGTNTTVYGPNGLNINNGAVIIDSAGLNAGGVIVSKDGINANDKVISNVGDGSLAAGSKDAINGGQVDTIRTDLENQIGQAGKDGKDGLDALAGNVSDALGGGAGYDKGTGTWTPPSYNVTDPTTGTTTPVNNVGDAIDGLNTAVNSPITFKDAGTGTSVNKLGSEFAIVGDDNITTTVTDGQAAIALNKDLKGLTSVETTDGTNTTTVRAGGTTSTDGTNTTIYGPNGLNINNGAVIIDSAGLNAGGVIISKDGINANDKVISNVGDAQNGKDATNLSQVENLIADATGSITTKGFSLTAQDGNTVNRKLGEAIEIEGDDNISTFVKDDKLAINLAKDLKVDSISAGGAILNSAGLSIGNTSISSGGLFIIGGPSLSISGINAGNKVITNIADGVNANDAINKGQLDTAINNIKDGAGSGNTDPNSVQYGKNLDGSIDKDSIALGGGIDGTSITNLADGKVETGSKDAINGGQLANVRDDLQGQINENTSDINSIKNEISNGSLGLVKQDKDTGNITVAKDTGGKKVDVSGTDGNRVITGIADGNIAKGSSDAATAGQLNTTYENLASGLGGGSKFENGTWTGPKYTVGQGESAKTVDNVGDAVTALNNADQVLDTKINSLGNRLEDSFRSTNNRIDRLEKDTKAAVAASIAIASLPQPFEKGTAMLSAGTGVWEGQVGVSIGASGITEDKKIFETPVNYVWKFASTTDSQGNWGGGASVGVQWK